MKAARNTSLWTSQELASVAKVIFSNVDKVAAPNEIPVRLCNYTDVYYNRRIDRHLNFMETTATQREIDKFQLRRGDVIITKDSETPDDIALPAYVSEEIPRLLCGYHLAILRPKPSVLDGRFLMQILQLQHVRHYFMTLANGVTRFGLGTDSISEAALKLPDFHAQRKIADILCTWDLALEKLDALISAKERRKHALVQKFLSGKRRLAGRAIQWTTKSLGDLIEPITRTITKPRKAFLAAGIRSHGKGVFLKSEFDPAKIALDELFEIKKDDLIVNITFAWEGATAIVPPEADGALVSHRFPTFRVKKSAAALPFIRHYIRTQRFVFDCGLASPGGAGRNRVLGKKGFLAIELPVPSLPEQQQIGGILDDADAELRLLRQQRDALDRQKRGLMQRLLTGKIRVTTGQEARRGK